MSHMSVVKPGKSSEWAGPRPQAGEPALFPVRHVEDSEEAALAAPRARTYERVLALALLVLVLPLLGAMLLFVLLADGRPALYRGERLGLRRRPFLMYKVRTLRREASQRTSERLLDARDRLEIRGGRFLRDTRLDELPQLWNIVRGEMSFLGPRPEREAICRLHCRTLHGYASRFAVLPGMLGPSQLFTPHATDKRIRAWLDNAWRCRERSFGEFVGLTAYTALVAARKVAARALESGRNDFWRSRVLRRYREQRRLRRVSLEDAAALLVPDGGRERETRAWPVDLNEEAILVRSPRSLRVGTRARIWLALEIGGGRSGARIRWASCDVVVCQRRRFSGGHALVLQYQPTGARSQYVLHQYFLRNALACPRARVVRGGRRASTEELLERALRPLPGVRLEDAAWAAAGLASRQPRRKASAGRLG